MKEIKSKIKIDRNKYKTNFEALHYFRIEKDENGIIFGRCIRHVNQEFSVGIKKGIFIKMVYIGEDKEYAEKLYSKLVSKHKQNS